ncbi:DUF4367 domain-containing protein [Oscillospiraceae bacterium LTW-04]|nr:DUF4367 domain-containing protein [Oscillospiraceae bacterium MB24-C1]
MSSTFNDLMGDVCIQALVDDFEALERSSFNDMPVRSLAAEEVATLAQKIAALPLEYMNTLFIKYYFNFSPEDTDTMLVTTHSAGRLRYAKNMLSHFMGLDGAIIDDHSMRLACEAALSAYVAQNVPDVWRIPKYSNAFRKKLKLVKAAQKSSSMVMAIMKRVAVFILICAISFSTALVANAKLRGRFMNWVVETFPKFSIFITQTEEPPSEAALSQSDIALGYLPDGYVLNDVSQGRNILKYNFLSGEKDKMLTISFEVTKAEVKTYYNTENSEMQRVDFKNLEAYAWQTDKKTYLVWIESDIECRISGNLDYKEIIKIAENVEFKK